MVFLRSRGPLFGLLVLALLLISPSQALAQGSPADSQYDTCGSRSVACVQYIGDAPETFTDNAGQGTSAVNDALAGPPSSVSTSGSTAPIEAGPSGPSSTSASPVSASAPGDEGGAAEDDAATDGRAGGAAGQAGGLASITELPETGGAPFPVLIAGVLLLSGGLCALRMFR